MRILFLAIKPANKLVDHKAKELLYDKYLEVFPGSVLYGPGYKYDSADVLEILEAHGGQNSFDAVWCQLPERVLLGEPFGENIIEHYAIPPKLWRFPVNLKAVRIPKILTFSDFWHLCPHEWAQIFLQHAFELVITGFLPPFIAQNAFHNAFPLQIRERVPFIPSAPYFSPDICRDLDQDRPYDIFMGGAQLPDFYPVRWQMFQAFRQSELSLYAPQHPGYNFQTQLPPKEKVFPYVRMLNSCKISAFCSTHFNFAPMKLFEAMASGTVALCNFMHGVEHLGLKPDEHFILADGGNCVEKAADLLRKPEKMLEMRDKARAVAHQRHTVERRAKDMAEMLPAVLNGEKPVHWAALSPNLKLVRARRRAAAMLQQPVPRVTQENIFDYGLTIRESRWKLWNRLGSMHYLPQEETQDKRIPALVPARHLLMGHLDMLKAELLIFLARKRNCRRIVEMGGGSGFFSLALAGWLHDESLEGNVLTVDDTPHDKPFCYMTPYTLERAFQRRHLTADLPGAERVNFILTGQWPETVKDQQPVDLLFLNRPASIAADYDSARPLLHRQTIIAVNSYGEGSPQVICAVEQLAAESGLKIAHFAVPGWHDGLALCAPEGSGAL